MGVHFFIFLICFLFQIKGSCALLPEFEDKQPSHIPPMLVSRVKCYQANLEDLKGWVEQERNVTTDLSFKFCLKKSEFLLKTLEELPNQLVLTEKILCAMLLNRVDELISRYNAKIKTKTLQAVSYKQQFDKVSFPSTDPQVYHGLKEHEQRIVDFVIDSYQTHTFVCLGLIAMVGNLQTLSEETKQLLCVFRTLWPLISGKSRDLGHPDAAIFDENGELSCEKDAFLFAHYGKKWITSLSDPASKCPFLSTAEFGKTYGHIQGGKVVYAVNPPGAFLQAIDYSIFTTKWGRLSKRIENFKKANKLDSKNCDFVCLRIDPSQLKECFPDLEVPDFLKKPPIHMVENDTLQPEPQAGGRKKRKRSKPKKAKQHTERDSQDDASGIKPTLTEAEKSEKQDVKMDEQPDEALEKENEMKTLAAEETPQPHMSQPQPVVRLKQQNVTRLEDWLAPSTSKPLSSTNRQTLEQIFQTSEASNVAFGSFQTLWEALGGRICGYKSGGSHRTLKDRGGKTVGGTYEPHGGRTYGPRSIRFLQKALQAVGANRFLAES